jgi:hypothetical protein
MMRMRRPAGRRAAAAADFLLASGPPCDRLAFAATATENRNKTVDRKGKRF